MIDNIFKVETRKFKYFITFFILGVLFYFLGDLFWDAAGSAVDIAFYMRTYEILILFVVLCMFHTWKKIDGHLFSLFSIFLFFFVVFNAGQFLFWSVGVHYASNAFNELGVARHIRYMDQNTLLRIMMVTLPSFCFCYSGALMVKMFDRSNMIHSYEPSLNNEIFRNNLRTVSRILFAVCYIVEMYLTVANAKVAFSTGYSSLYYGDSISVNTLFKYLSYFFFPSVFGILIGNEFSKKSFRYLSIAMIPYIFVNLIIGDRGNWVYFILVWAWVYIYLVCRDDNKVRIKKLMLRVAILAIIALLATNVFTKFRDVGASNITAQDAIEVIKDLPFNFIKPFFEMGQSARCLGIVIQDSLDKIWKGGNTYIASILSMPLPRFKVLFGFPDGYFENWFSQSYLGITNYGLGFTCIAEAYLNGGYLFFPIYMFLYGAFMSLMCDFRNPHIKDSKRAFLALSSTVLLITSCRATMELSLRKWFYGCLLFYIVVGILSYKPKAVYEIHQQGESKE